MQGMQLKGAATKTLEKLPKMHLQQASSKKQESHGAHDDKKAPKSHAFSAGPATLCAGA
jgi:hypothetical protein